MHEHNGLLRALGRSKKNTPSTHIFLSQIPFHEASFIGSNNIDLDLLILSIQVLITRSTFEALIQANIHGK